MTMIRTELIAAFEQLQQTVVPTLPDDESGQLVQQRFEQLLEALNTETDSMFLAEELLTQLITHYPNFTPCIPRALLWAVGGSCLHFMGDDEIEQFSNLEEQQDIRH